MGIMAKGVQIIKVVEPTYYGKGVYACNIEHVYHTWLLEFGDLWVCLWQLASIWQANMYSMSRNFRYNKRRNHRWWFETGHMKTSTDLSTYAFGGSLTLECSISRSNTFNTFIFHLQLRHCTNTIVHCALSPNLSLLCPIHFSWSWLSASFSRLLFISTCFNGELVFVFSWLLSQ